MARIRPTPSSGSSGPSPSTAHVLGLAAALALVVPAFVAGVPALLGSGNAAPAGPGPAASGPAAEATPDPAERFSIEERNDWVDRWLATMDEDGDRVDDRAEDRAGQHVDAGDYLAPVGLKVTFDHWPTADDRDLLASLGAEVTYEFHRIPTLVVEAPAAAVPSTGALDGVEAVEWNEPVEPALDVGPPAIQSLESSGDDLETPYNGETAEALGYTGQGQVIAVLDTGVRDTHDALEGKFVAGAVTTSGTTECVNPEDEDGHGTHVAGIAMGNESGSDFQGSAPSAELVEVKISAGPGSLGGVDRGFEWVADYNAAIDRGDPRCGVSAEDRVNVLTLSFGSAGPGGQDAGSSETLIEDLNEQGVVVTIAAGNCGPEPSASCSTGGQEHTISSPGNAAGAITVANVDDQATVDRGDDVINPSSSRGPNENVSRENLTDRFRKPEIGAPGTDIKSASNLEEPFVQYYNLTGTSMATPMVAGAAAQLLQAGEEVRDQTDGVNALAPRGTGYHGDGDTRVGQNPVREAFAEGAEYMTAGVTQSMVDKWEGPGVLAETWNNAFGYGEANVFASTCWSWRNILKPAGATPPSDVRSTCGITADALDVTTNAAWAEVDEETRLVADATGGLARYDYTWSVADAPSGASTTFTTPDDEETGFAADTPGAYAVEVEVTDSEGETATAVAPVTVYDPPTTSTDTVASFTFESSGECDEESWTSLQFFGFSGDGPSGSTTWWHLEEQDALSDPCAWYHGTDLGQYENNQNAYIASPGGSDCFDLASGLAEARFTFSTAGTLEEDFDFLHAERSPCDADSWTRLKSWTGSRGSWQADPPVYEEASVDVSDRIGGEAFQLRLRVRTDSIVTDTGYRLDTFDLSTEAPLNNEDPVADFTSSCDGFTCTFDASDSTDPDGDLLSHVWTFEDGVTLLGETVTRTFDEPGNHSLTLTVTDDDGARDTLADYVIVRGPLDVEELDPQTVEAGTTTTVDVLGTGFKGNLDVTLEDGPGPEPTITVVDVDSHGTWIETEITVPDEGPPDITKWDVVVTNPDGEADTLEDGLHVFRTLPE